MPPLILKRASASRSSGQWRDDDFDVLETASSSDASSWRLLRPRAGNGCGRGNGDIRRAAYGCEPPREAAMAAFTKSCRRRI
jgi:hypothetical protein